MAMMSWLRLQGRKHTICVFLILVGILMLNVGVKHFTGLGTHQLFLHSVQDVPSDNRLTRFQRPPASSTTMEVVGLIKLEIPESNSWETIAKILTLLLASVLGIRLINAMFNRWESPRESHQKKEIP
jgi:NO-binding membrane sensor protein with MHYT domain